MLDQGRDEVWYAVPEEVICYHLSRRHVRVKTLADTGAEQRYRLSFEGLN